MASVTAFIRSVSKNKDRKVNVRFHLSDGRKTQLYHKSEILVLPDYFDNKKQEINARMIFDKDEKTKFKKDIATRKILILSIYDSTPGLTTELLNLKIDQSLHPEKYISEEDEIKQQSYFELFDEFLKLQEISEGRKAHYKVLKRALQRFELYKAVKLDINTISKDTIRDIQIFLEDEKSVYNERPEIYEEISESRKPQPRGKNTISGMLSRYRTFCLWLVNEGKTTNNPFKSFSVPGEVYGTPFYITDEERKNLFNFDLSKRPQLAIQRDIFIFHCLIGCRIGDLYSLKKSSVINGGIEYIARKTIEGNPVTVRVPLNATAKEILSRYPENDGEKLLPFISEQNYNKAIREMFEIAGLTRIVTVLNSATREEEKRPLNEIASSHLARRAFIGNLYKKVKDPNLVGNLSGHVEGSKAFARYREIDEEMKIDLVNLLD